MLSFPPFRLDADAERIWKHEAEVHLRRKPFAILRYLAQNPDRLVTHDEILEAIWGRIAMSESLLRTHIRDLRRALGDDIVETVVGRGYRFASEVTHVQPEASAHGEVYSARDSERALLVGRDAELAALQATLYTVRGGRRTAVFVSGEGGVGKTAIVDRLLEVSAPSGVLVGRGACVERYGSGLAYLPVLDAVRALCRGQGGDRVVDTMAKHAPTWLSQLPGIVCGARLEELQRRAAGATQARMMTELAQAVEALSSDAPLVIVFEDLQWIDPSTAELLAFLCKRREPARCLLVGTYRRAEVPRGHPLSRVVAELVAHRQAASVELAGFDVQDIEEYLGQRFGAHGFCPELSANLLRSTGGNPLFIAALADELQDRGVIFRRNGVWQLTSVEEVDTDKPDVIVRFIHAQLDRLDAIEQRVIEVASVAGMTFTVGAVAHALDADPDAIDSCCVTLANDRKLLRFLGSEKWPDGTTQSHYAFGHAMFHHAALERTPPASARAWRRKMARGPIESVALNPACRPAGQPG